MNKKQSSSSSSTKKLSKKEHEKQLLLKIMQGDDTVDTAQIVRSENKLKITNTQSIRSTECGSRLSEAAVRHRLNSCVGLYKADSTMAMTRLVDYRPSQS